MKTLIVNLFGAPGAGKSTGAAYIFYKLKQLGYNAEYVSEFAKDKVWEKNDEVFKNQAYIFGKQYFKISRCLDKVDIIVTDSPLLLSYFYNYNEVLGEHFDNCVKSVFYSMNNINYFINRVKPYNPSGRLQNEAESDELALDFKSELGEIGLKYTEVNGDEEGYNKVLIELTNIIDVSKHSK